MGAPGPFTWRGTIFVHEVAGQDFMYRDKTMYHGPLNDNRYPIDKYSYMGMSVDGGKFFQNKPFIYISGAPRSNMTGQVFFMNKISKSDEMNILELILNGTQLGSGFGYQLLVTDLNNDGYDDLLVGAPFFFKMDMVVPFMFIRIYVIVINRIVNRIKYYMAIHNRDSVLQLHPLVI